MKTALKSILLPAVVLACTLFQACGAGPDSVYSTRAAEDIGKAVTEAKAGNKRVLVDVGSKGCIWCVRLHSFITDDPELSQLAARSFVTVRVDYRANAALLNGYGRVEGTPHFFVLDNDGKLLRSQDTAELEAGKSYDRAKVLAFFKTWGN
ncbi:MAG TPA: thiol-disulfide isomerase [Elusimicrobia bacterium]|nr:thiol-disulfide isomerase [Elusimicrobiota bacterium]